jgi:hypothetical protein
VGRSTEWLNAINVAEIMAIAVNAYNAGDMSASGVDAWMVASVLMETRPP